MPRSFGRLRFLLFAVLVLAGCQSQPVAVAPTPQTVIVALSPALHPWVEKITTCAAADPSIQVVVDEKDVLEANLGEYVFAIRLGEPSETPSFITQIGTEALVVIVHPQIPLSHMKTADLQAVYSGQISDWSALSSSSVNVPSTSVSLWNYSDGNSLRTLFERDALSGANNPAVFNLAPGPAQMLSAVGTIPGAIGYLPASWVDDTVHPVQISDLAAGALTAPVLAMAAAQPTGAPAVLLHCIMDTGQH
jgi:hypothetical protein